MLWRCSTSGRSLFATGEYAEAIASYQAAKGAGYNADQCALAIGEAQRYMGDAAAALATLDALSGAIEQTAEYLYQRGATVAALGGNPTEVVALVRAGGGDRSAASRGAVWPGAGVRSPR